MSGKYQNVSKSDINKFYQGKYTQEHLDGSESEYSLNNINDDLEKMVQDFSGVSESDQQFSVSESGAESEQLVSTSEVGDEYKKYNQAYKNAVTNTSRSSGAKINPAKAKVNKRYVSTKSNGNNHITKSSLNSSKPNNIISNNPIASNNVNNNVINNSNYAVSEETQSEIEYSIDETNIIKEKLAKSNIDVTNMSETTLIEIDKMTNKFLELDTAIKNLSKQRSGKAKERKELKNKLEQIMIKYKQNELIKERK
jgi:hypothetical protein